MRSFAMRTLVNGMALWLAALVLPDVRLGEDAPELSVRLVTILLVAIVFGLVNAVIKPVVSFFSLPLFILTLGLFTIIVNALMLVITAAISGAIGLDFHVDTFFWGAVFASLIVSFVSILLSGVVREERRR